MPTGSLPPIGLGTWENTDPEECATSVATALEMGYEHVDTAGMYGNEEYVGEGLARADVPREEYVLATKVHPMGRGVGYEDVLAAGEGSLDRLGVQRIDLLYVHWPVGGYDPEETLPAFDELVDRGVIDRVGVSNFSTEQVERARAILDAPVFANQVEMHPFLPQEELVAHAREHDYYLVAYSPLARGRVLEDDLLGEIAAKHGATAAQVSLAWLLTKDNVVVIPKATSEAHIRDNLAALELALDPEDVERIDAIDREERFVEREGAPWLEAGDD